MKRRVPISELIDGDGSAALTTCPECGKTGFYTGKPWEHKGERGPIYRTRRCRWCGYSRTERVVTTIEEV